jgi:ABC-type dipeptide/oligopeptide/nickel transport system ATPase component
MSAQPLLEVHVSVDYPGRPGVLRNVSLEIAPGEIVGLAGQSGSGKSTLALAALQLLGSRKAAVSGEILFRGRDLLSLKESEMRRVRGREIGLVLQSPLAALNPALQIGTQLRESWLAHADGRKAQWDEYVRELLDSVSLPSDEAFLQRYPRQLSVGLAQRVLVASAIVHRPALLLADEPTSALDVITQSEVLELFARLSRERGMAMLYISHDLLSVAALCHRVAILHQGEIVELGETERVFQEPRHPYTRRLIAALPRFQVMDQFERA